MKGKVGYSATSWGKEFVHRVIGIVESYSQMQQQLDREWTAFNSQWKKCKKLSQRGMLNIAETCGDLSGLCGFSVSKLEQLNLLERDRTNPDRRNAMVKGLRPLLEDGDLLQP